MNRLSIGISKALGIIMGVLIIVTITGIAITYTNVGDIYSDTVTGNRTFPNIIGGIVLVFLILWFFMLLDKVPDEKNRLVSAVLFIIFTLMVGIVLFFFTTVPLTDSFYVHDYAIAMAKGIHSQIDGSTVYFGKYSNNNPLIILFYFIYKMYSILGIEDYLQVGRIVNGVAIITAQVLFFTAVKKFTGKYSTANKFMLLSLMFVPIIFMVQWVYTATLCLPFLGGILLCGVNIINSKNRKTVAVNSAVIGVLSIVGYNIRPVVLILSIAFGICLLLYVMKDRKRMGKAIVVSLICIVVAGTSFFVCKEINDYYYTGSDKNFPLTHWVAMGLTENGTYDSALVRENEKLKNGEEIKKNVHRDIMEKLKSYTPSSFISHLYIKNGNIWGVGSLEYPLRLAGVSDNPNIAKYITGSKSEFLYFYCQMLWLALHILTLIFIVQFLFNRHSQRSLLFILTLFGGYAFYMIWEVKPAYAIPFVFLILIMATLGADRLNRDIALDKSKFKLPLKVVYTVAVFVSIIAMIVTAPYFTDNRITVNDTVLKITSTHNEFIEDVAKANRVITQEFYTDNEFNCVELTLGRDTPENCDGETKYVLTLYNEKGEVIGKDELIRNYEKEDKNSSPIKREMFLGKSYVPDSREKFTLVIKGIGSDNSYKFSVSRGECIDPLEGNLKINGEKYKGDLRFAVINSTKTTITTYGKYISLCTVVLAVEVLAYFCLFKKTKRKDSLSS